MSFAQIGEPLGKSPATRRAVRAERASVLRWRRLLRARLDLLVASYAPPEGLGAMGWDVLPHAQQSVPSTEELRAALDGCTDMDRVQTMHRLRALDRRLAVYAEQIDDALDVTTEELVIRLLTDELARADDQR